jgi:hypothetical protein
LDDLLPLRDFRLYAVCVRYPQELATHVELTRLRDGVYEVRTVGLPLRLIMANQLPEAEPNALLHFFSSHERLWQYGRAHNRPHSTETSTLLYQLFQLYREDLTMSDKLAEFARQTLDELLRTLPAEERLKGLPAEELRKRLPVEERLKGLSADEVLRALSPELRAALRQQLQASGASPPAP